jgi:hypothetical protein
MGVSARGWARTEQTVKSNYWSDIEEKALLVGLTVELFVSGFR